MRSGIAYILYENTRMQSVINGYVKITTNNTGNDNRYWSNRHWCYGAAACCFEKVHGTTRCDITAR
jgi:hypothetical protein